MAGLRLVALGLVVADSAISSAGGGLQERSFAHVRDTGFPMDQAEPSCGRRGEGVKIGAFAETSLPSNALGPRPGVVTFEAEAVVTASPSMVDGGLPLQRLEGLAVLLMEEASDQLGGSTVDIPATDGKAVDERRAVKEVTLVGTGAGEMETAAAGFEGACADDRVEPPSVGAVLFAKVNEAGWPLLLTLRWVEGRKDGSDGPVVMEDAWRKEGERCCMRCGARLSAMPCTRGEQR